MNTTTRIYHGDILNTLRGRQWMVESGFVPKAHAIISDPPYFLGEMTKRFGKAGSAAPKGGVYQRQSRGFMGETWDGFSDVYEFQAWVTEWATLLLDFVHPGAVGAFFGGTRTYHRVAAGLEDAGWIVFDCVMAWQYATGFPKSHDISKAITKHPENRERLIEVKRWLAEQFEKSGKSKAQIDAECGFRASGYLSIEPGNDITGRATWHLLIPTGDKWKTLKRVVGFDSGYDAYIEELAKIESHSKAGLKRNIYGTYSGVETDYELTAQATLWDGYGTALKPSYEPIILARAPRSGTFAQMAETFGTGALNIDGARIPGAWSWGTQTDIRGGKYNTARPSEGDVFARDVESNPGGRWPANTVLICECGGEHVPGCPVAELDRQSGQLTSGTGAVKKETATGWQGSCYGKESRPVGTPNIEYGDTGTASRFFYTAKASQWEREAGLQNRTARNVNDGRQTPIDNAYQRGDTQRLNVHPTVKPIQLIHHLATLLLPPALSEPRRLLVPFSGSGSEMIGASLAGWDDITGFEQSAEYIAIANSRIAWWSQFKDYEQAERAYKAEHKIAEAESKADPSIKQMELFAPTAG